jgi:hypothetical protein
VAVRAEIEKISRPWRASRRAKVQFSTFGVDQDAGINQRSHPDRPNGGWPLFNSSSTSKYSLSGRGKLDSNSTKSAPVNLAGATGEIAQTGSPPRSTKKGLAFVVNPVDKVGEVAGRISWSKFSRLLRLLTDYRIIRGTYKAQESSEVHPP